MKPFFATLILLSIITSVHAQQKTLAKFIVTDASFNNQDATELYLNEGTYIVFYTTGDGNLYMANVVSKLKSQSYGRLYSSEHKQLNETYETYKADIFYFRWRYLNSYDTKKGTATIKLIKTYKPQGVAFSCTIVAEDLDVLTYKGYMEGSLDFSDYSN